MFLSVQWRQRYMLAFGAFFTAVSTFALVVLGIAKHDPLGIAIGIAMMACGVWVTSMGIVGVPVASGRSVGGGPLLPRVRLEPGEAVTVQDRATFRFERAPDGLRGSLRQAVQGELFLTDRWLIFSPYRLSLRLQPVALPYTDIDHAEEIVRFSFISMSERCLQIAVSNGSVYCVWPRSRETTPALRTALERSDIPPAPSILAATAPTFAEVIMSWGATGYAWAFVVGATEPPYIRRLHVDFIFFLACAFTGAALYTTWRHLRDRFTARGLV